MYNLGAAASKSDPEGEKRMRLKSNSEES